jgi:hypothetical protein
MLDIARLARLERARQHAERQLRLGYPDAKAKLKRIASAEQRALRGESEARYAAHHRGSCGLAKIGGGHEAVVVGFARDADHAPDSVPSPAKSGGRIRSFRGGNYFL